MGSIKQLFWVMTILDRAMLFAHSLSKDKQAVLSAYYNHVAALFVTNVYNPALFNDSDIGVLPPLHRFGCYAVIGQKARETGDDEGYKTAMAKALDSYPEMLKAFKLMSEQG
jgi:hypothetical protein